jgi:hypothetical protein
MAASLLLAPPVDPVVLPDRLVSVAVPPHADSHAMHVTHVRLGARARIRKKLG